MKTRAAERYLAKNYLQRTEECKETMKAAFEESRWNACVINAVHCVIAAADAFCVHKLGLRNAGENHRDSIALFLSADPASQAVKEAVRHLTSLLSIKTDAEYGERLLSQADAEAAVKHAERLLRFVKERLAP
jgi:HEPN domain-containing protein